MKNIRLKLAIPKIFSVIIALSFMTSFGAYALENENGVEEAEKITTAFVKDAKCSVISDSDGEPVILLTKEEALPNVKSNETQHVKKTVAILPSSDQEKEEIIQNIGEVTRGVGNHTEDGWFFGSSVYLSTTINYTTSYINGLKHGEISYVKISCSTNSGTQITSMSLNMGQIGPSGNNGAVSQKKTFNATTARTIYAPSNWVPIVWEDAHSSAGAHLTATAKRSSGATSTFTLYNIII
jgi:hypothetical protein